MPEYCIKMPKITNAHRKTWKQKKKRIQVKPRHTYNCMRSKHFSVHICKNICISYELKLSWATNIQRILSSENTTLLFWNVYIKKEDKQVKERGKKRRRQSEINSWQLLLMMISLGGGNYVQPNEKYLTSLRSTQVIISVYVKRWGGNLRYLHNIYPQPDILTK